MKKSEESIGIVDICFLIWKGRERRSLFLITFISSSSFSAPTHVPSFSLQLPLLFTETPVHGLCFLQTAWPSPLLLPPQQGAGHGHLSLSQQNSVDSNESENLGLPRSACLPLRSFLFSSNCIMIVWVFFYKDGALGLSLVRWCFLSCFQKSEACAWIRYFLLGLP